jgi:hypothetical protein
MFPSIDFSLATTATIIVIICYVLLLVKMKSPNKSSEFSKLNTHIQETYEDLSGQRRIELLEKIKEERIKEYLDHKERR